MTVARNLFCIVIFKVSQTNKITFTIIDNTLKSERVKARELNISIINYTVSHLIPLPATTEDC